MFQQMQDYEITRIEGLKVYGKLFDPFGDYRHVEYQLTDDSVITGGRSVKVDGKLFDPFGDYRHVEYQLTDDSVITGGRSVKVDGIFTHYETYTKVFTVGQIVKGLIITEFVKDDDTEILSKIVSDNSVSHNTCINYTVNKIKVIE
jgi:hypothetical protein